MTVVQEWRSIFAAAQAGCRPCARWRPRPWPCRQASDKVYTVANYPVEASAENAVAAKERALADGPAGGLPLAVEAPHSRHGLCPRPSDWHSVRAADLIEGVRVRSERNSSTDYIASFDFSLPIQGRSRPAAPRGHSRSPTSRRPPSRWSRCGAAGGGARRPGTRRRGPRSGRGSISRIRSLRSSCSRCGRRSAPKRSMRIAAGDGSAMRALAGEYRTRVRAGGSRGARCRLRDA